MISKFTIFRKLKNSTFYILHSTFSARGGFTLIELLIVIAIIGILAAVGLNTFPAALARGRDSQRVGDARAIVTAVEQYKTEKGKYPPVSGCSLDWCNSGAGSNAENTWIPDLVPNYLPAVPQDPKDTASPNILYFYITDGNDYCFMTRLERDASTSRNYRGIYIYGGISYYELRFGPSGPKLGLCDSR